MCVLSDKILTNECVSKSRFTDVAHLSFGEQTFYAKSTCIFQFCGKRKMEYISSSLSYKLFVVSIMQEDAYIGYTILVLTHGLQVFS